MAAPIGFLFTLREQTVFGGKNAKICQKWLILAVLFSSFDWESKIGTELPTWGKCPMSPAPRLGATTGRITRITCRFFVLFFNCSYKGSRKSKKYGRRILKIYIY